MELIEALELITLAVTMTVYASFKLADSLGTYRYIHPVGHTYIDTHIGRHIL